MDYLITTLIFFALLSCWIWVSVKLFGIYSRGVELEYTLKYKALQKGTRSGQRRRFTAYLTILWIVEVLTGVSTIIISSIWMKTIF